MTSSFGRDTGQRGGEPTDQWRQFKSTDCLRHHRRQDLRPGGLMLHQQPGWSAGKKGAAKRHLSW